MSLGSLVLGYVRVSVAHEDPLNQEEAIRRYCREKGYTLLKIYRDVVTGTVYPMDRPGFREMIRAAEEFGIHRVVIYDVSRLGRKLTEVVAALREMHSRGIVPEFVRHPELDASNPVVYNTLIFAFGLAAEIERQSMKERMEAARAAGKRIGRRPVEIPWDKVERLLRRGWRISEIYKYLVGEGALRYHVKGAERVMTYEHFRRRVKRWLEERRGGRG